MKTTGIRIEVPEEMYKTLIEMQKLQWEYGGKKPALSSIIIDLCQAGIAISQQNVQTGAGNVQNRVNESSLRNNSTSETNADKRNRHMEDFYQKWEASLNERSLLLRSQENDLLEAREDFFQKQNDFIQEKEKLATKSLAGPDQIIEMKMLKLDLEHKNEIIHNQQKEISQNQAATIKTIKEIELLVKQQRKGNDSIWDKIIPWIPSAVNAIGLFMIYNKVGIKSDLSGLPQEIREVFKNIDPENRQKITKTFMDSVQGFFMEQKQTKKQDSPKVEDASKKPEK